MTDDTEEIVSTGRGDQQSLTGESVEEQSMFTVDEGVRVPQGRKPTPEAELNTGGLAKDNRTDPDRGAENEHPDTTQYTLQGHAKRDEGQTGLEIATDVDQPGFSE